MNFRLLIERPGKKNIQIFAQSRKELDEVAKLALSNLPDGVSAVLYETKEVRVGQVLLSRGKDRKLSLIASEVDTPIEREE